MKSECNIRQAIFKDTIEWIQKDQELSDFVLEGRRNTQIFYEDEYPNYKRSYEYDSKITVTKERSFEAARNLMKTYPEAKIAVMNFANAFVPGGGVIDGAGAQEECLCRESTLYPILNRRSLKEGFYNYHRNINSVKATDSLIYSEGIVVCKTDELRPRRLPRDEWISVDVITVSAPDLRKKMIRYVPVIGNILSMSRAELLACHIKRAVHMMTVAAHKNVDVLVLGAFGCGAFENDPEVVAEAYKYALKEFCGVFKEVRFAVFCSDTEEQNYRIFNKILNKEK